MTQRERLALLRGDRFSDPTEDMIDWLLADIARLEDALVTTRDAIEGFHADGSSPCWIAKKGTGCDCGIAELGAAIDAALTGDDK